MFLVLRRQDPDWKCFHACAVSSITCPAEKNFPVPSQPAKIAETLMWRSVFSIGATHIFAIKNALPQILFDDFAGWIPMSKI